MNNSIILRIKNETLSRYFLYELGHIGRFLNLHWCTFKTGWQCKESNVNDVFISSLICRAQKRLNDKVIAVNNILKRVCKLNGLGFIDNMNICVENLFDNGLHLNDDGKVI